MSWKTIHVRNWSECKTDTMRRRWCRKRFKNWKIACFRIPKPIPKKTVTRFGHVLVESPYDGVLFVGSIAKDEANQIIHVRFGETRSASMWIRPMHGLSAFMWWVENHWRVCTEHVADPDVKKVLLQWVEQMDAWHLDGECDGSEKWHNPSGSTGTSGWPLESHKGPRPSIEEAGPVSPGPIPTPDETGVRAG